MTESVKKNVFELVSGGLGGILLGLYVLGVSFLPTQFQVLFSIALLCPIIAMLVGSLSRILLAIMIPRFFTK